MTYQLLIARFGCEGRIAFVLTRLSQACECFDSCWTVLIITPQGDFLQAKTPTKAFQKPNQTGPRLCEVSFFTSHSFNVTLL